MKSGSLNEHGKCQVCAQVVSLKKDGMLRGHVSQALNELWCQGSWQPPQEQNK